MCLHFESGRQLFFGSSIEITPFQKNQQSLHTILYTISACLHQPRIYINAMLSLLSAADIHFYRITNYPNNRLSAVRASDSL